MGDNIKAELFYGDNKVAALNEYSVKQYAEKLLYNGYNSENAEEMIQFVTDMLTYGAAAQIYKNYDADNLANDIEFFEYISAKPSEALPESSDKELTVAEGVTLGDTCFKSAGVLFDNVNRLYFRFTVGEADKDTVRIKLGDKEYEPDSCEYDNETGYYTLYTDAISATGFDKVYTVCLMLGDSEVQTLEYSVNSYVYAKMNETLEDGETLTPMADLARALYRYGVSGKAYQESLNQ